MLRGVGVVVTTSVPYTDEVGDVSDKQMVAVNVMLDVDPDAVLGELASAGLHVLETHDLLGVVTGTIVKTNLERLSHIDGVVAVEPNREIKAFD